MDAPRRALLAAVASCAIILPAGGLALPLMAGQPPAPLQLAGQAVDLLLKLVGVSSLLIGLLSIPILRRSPED